jgi:hypothetical protein
MEDEEIKDLLAKHPWIFGNCELANVKGERGKAIDVNISGLSIDLMLKELSDNRPVIVGVKSGDSIRQDIGQMLAYRSLLATTIESELLNEFGENKLVPRLVLVVEDIEDEDRIACNLAGIEVRTFGADSEQIPVDIDTRLERWREVIEGGNPPISERKRWIDNIHSSIKTACDRINNKHNLEENVVFRPAKLMNNSVHDDYLFINGAVLFEPSSTVVCNFYEMDVSYNYPYNSKFIYSAAFFRDLKNTKKSFNKFCKKLKADLSLEVTHEFNDETKEATFQIPRSKITAIVPKYITRLVSLREKSV